MHADRRTDKQTYKQTDEQTNWHTNRQTDGLEYSIVSLSADSERTPGM